MQDQKGDRGGNQERIIKGSRRIQMEELRKVTRILQRTGVVRKHNFIIISHGLSPKPNISTNNKTTTKLPQLNPQRLKPTKGTNWVKMQSRG